MTATEPKEENDSLDIGHIIGQKYHVVADALAVNEQMFFIYDDRDESLNIMVYLSPFKSFAKRLKVAIGYLFYTWWMYGGNWEMFTFNKDEAERLIAFLKKVK